MKKLLIALALLLGSTAQALPPYGFNMTQVDSSGDFFWGYYFLPPTPSASYIFMYDGTGIPSTNPLRMTAIGTGLSWDGTTLTAAPSSGQITTGLGYTPYNATNPNSYINLATARAGLSVTTTGTNCGNASYNSSTGAINVPGCTPGSSSQSSSSRSLNTAFQVNTTRGAFVFYSVQITVTATIAGGQNGDVVLEIASDSAFTTNVQTLSISGVGQTYSLAVALQGVQPQTSVVSGYVPPGYYTRLRTVNNTGTPGFSYRAGQEVLM